MESETNRGHPIVERTSELGEIVAAELGYVGERRDAVGLGSKDVESVTKARNEIRKALDEVREGRANDDVDSEDLLAPSWRRKTLEAQLIGLALSGGGIRSATFNLGLLQALAKADLLRHFDYLSTVSGGGYIGSCLTSLLHSNVQPSRKKKDDRESDSGGESGASGQSDADKIDVSAGLSVRAEEFPFRFEDAQPGDEREELKHLRSHGSYLLPSGRLLSLEFWRLIGMYLTGVVVNNFVPLAIVLALAFAGNVLRPKLVTSDIHMRVYLLGAGMFVVAVVVRAVGAFFNLSVQLRRFRGRLVGALMGVAAVVAAVGGLIHLTTVQGITEDLKDVLLGLSGASIAGLPAGLVPKGEQYLQRVMDKIFQVARVAVVPLFLIQAFVWLTASPWITYEIPKAGIPISLALAAVLSVASFYINPNRTSMHHFYRDRLSEAFVIWSREGQVDSNEDLDLSDLYPEGGKSGAPYHILNTTLNVPSTLDRDLRGRGSDLFIYSGFYCGSEATGYCRTARYREIKGDTRLATAMAVSGAALSPQMGAATGPLQSFLLTLLNVRLNRWVPNPSQLFLWFDGKLFRWNIRRKKIYRAWPLYFFRELFSRGTEDDDLLNLSDGGHFENLGVYALLQRRCKYIVASDSGRDPKFAFSDLSNLIRKARIDLGVAIEIDLKGLEQDKKKDDEPTPLHYAVGTIEYPGEEELGILIVLKTTWTGKEPQDLKDYKRRNESFPDETTGDQFFTEPQFESYRKLGEISGKEIVAAAQRKDEAKFQKGVFTGTIDEFFQAVQSDYETT